MKIYRFLLFSLVLTGVLLPSYDLANTQKFAKNGEIRSEELYPDPLHSSSWKQTTSLDSFPSSIHPLLSQGHLLAAKHHVLEPQEQLQLLLHPYQQLKISSPEKNLSEDDLQIACSIDSKIFAQHKEWLQKGNGSFIFNPTPEYRTRLCKITNISRGSNGQGKSLELVLALNEIESAIPPTPPSSRVDIGYRQVKIAGEQMKEASMGVLDGNKEHSVEIDGPQILALEQRLLYFDQDVARHIDYRVEIKLRDRDGKEGDREVFEFSSLPEQHQRTTMNDRTVIVGRLEKTTFDVPQGHFTLTITPTQPLLARLLRIEESPYLLETLNNASQDKSQALLYQRGYLSPRPFWNEPLNTVQSLNSSHLPADRLLQLSRRIGKDNQQQPGGLTAENALRQQVARRPGLRKIIGSRPELLAPNTYYRTLLPLNKPTEEPDVSAWFIPSQLSVPLAENLVIGEQHQAELLSMLSNSIFVALPGTEKDEAASSEETTLPPGMSYRIPPRSADSRLRLAFLLPENEHKLELLFDTGSRFLLQLSPKLEGDKAASSLTTGAAGLALLQRRFPHYDKKTLGGPFSLYQTPAPLRSVASIELVLPKNVQQIRIRQTDSSRHPVHMAIQYRDGGFSSLSEREFLAALDKMGGLPQLRQSFPQWLKREDTSPGEEQLSLENLTSLATRDIENDYSPLIRYLHSLAYTYTAGISHLPGDDVAGPKISQAEGRNYLAQAQNAERQEQWLVALEKYKHLFRSPSEDHLIAATLGRANCLEKLGESYLAELMLKGTYLFPRRKDDRALSKASFTRLRQIYRRDKREDKLLQLEAVEFVRKQHTDLIPSLAKLMFSEGLYRHALLLSLLHPDLAQTTEPLLYGALLCNWPKTYEKYSHRLLSAEGINYFSILAKLREKEIDNLPSLIAQAGDAGKILLASRQEAQEIFDALKAGQLKPEELKQRWLHWQETRPGPTVWKNRSDSIVDYQGGGLQLSEIRHLFGRLYRGTPKRPVSLRLRGPATFRFTVRPLHFQDNNSPLDDWLKLQVDGKKTLFPLNNNFVSRTVRFFGEPKQYPGQRFVFTREFGPGDHNVKLHGRNLPILIQVEEKLPALGSDILPPYSEAAFMTLYTNQSTEKLFSDEKSLLSCLTDECLELVTENGVVRECSAKIEHEFEDLLAFNPPLPQTGQQRPGVVQDPGEPQNTTPCLNDPTQDQDSCLAQLIFTSEPGGDVNRDWLLGRAKQLFLEDPENRQRSDLLKRDILQGSWESVELVSAPAGIRFVTYRGWQPASPFLRTRKALLPEVEPDEKILYDEGGLIYSLRNSVRTRLKVRLRLLEIPYLPIFPLKTRLKFSGDSSTRPTQEFFLDRNNSTVTTIFTLQPGEHQLRFSLQKRFINQFLAVQVTTDRATAGNNAQPALYTNADSERSYLIAKPGLPVTATIQAPAMLRIDSLKDDELHSSYRYIEGDGIKTIQLGGENDKETLYRLYRLRPRTKSDESTGLLRPPLVHNESLKEPPSVYIEIPPELPGSTEEDDYPNIGSIEIYAALNRRRNLDEDSGSDQLEKFLELGSTHRYYSEDIPAHFTGTGLWRIREEGGPVLGLKEGLSWYPRFTSATLRFEAQLFLQDPSASQFDQTSLFDSQYSFLLRASATQRRELGTNWYHIPGVSIFGRILSLEDKGDYPSDSVDRDIFTTYKKQHSNGVRIADTLYYRPWLDTIFLSGASINSNEFPQWLVPDNLRFRLGLKQLLGNLQLDLEYRRSFYFNDDNRTRSSQRDTLKFGLHHDIFYGNANRIELGAMIRQDLTENEQEYLLKLSLHLNDTPSYHHYRFSEIDFRNLKTYRRERGNADEEQSPP